MKCPRCGAVWYISRSGSSVLGQSCDYCDEEHCTSCLPVEFVDSYGSVHFFCSTVCRVRWQVHEAMLQDAADVEYALREMGDDQPCKGSR